MPIRAPRCAGSSENGWPRSPPAGALLLLVVLGSLGIVLARLPVAAGAAIIVASSAQLADAAPHPHAVVLPRAISDDPRLSDVTRLETDQLRGLETLLNRTATKSWEIGTHLSALLELSYPALSPYADSASSWARPSSSSSPRPFEILTAVDKLFRSQESATQVQLVSDGSAADPASVGPFVVLANFTLDGDDEEQAQLGGRSKPQVEAAVQRQVDALLRATPRTPAGAISHRTEDVELWSDFMYMVPPFFAYLGALTGNTSLMTEAYTQSSLYRDQLRDPRTGLWRHIENRFEGGGGRADDGLWATGNGWAAAGMARVLATLVNHPDNEIAAQFANQSRDLAAWTGEIIEGTWVQPRTSDGLRYNYLNETNSFGDASGTALLSAATFRLSLLSRRFSTEANPLTSPSTRALASAENSYRALVPARISSAGVVSPVVDPMSFREELDGIRADGTGASSPEAGAFILLLEAARRDWVQENSGREPPTSLTGEGAGADGGWSSSSSAARRSGRDVLRWTGSAAAAVAALVGLGLV